MKLKKAMILALSETSRMEALRTVESLALQAKDSKMLAQCLDGMIDGWNARTLGLLSVMPETFNWRTMEGRKLEDDSFRMNAVLLVCGNQELIDRVEAVVREYRDETKQPA